MKEELLQRLESAGIPSEQATKAIDVVMGFLQENPDKLTDFLGIDDDSMIDDIKNKVTGLFKR